MKVYACYEVYYDYCNEWQSLVKIVDCEVKALIWKEEVKPTETEWRSYQEFALE